MRELTTRFRPLLAAAAGLLLLCAAPAVHAKDSLYSRYLTRFPGGSLADPMPLLSADLNPAAAALLSGPEALFVWSSALQGVTVGDDWFRVFHLAVGLQHLTPDGQKEGWRTDLDVSFGLSRSFALGLLWQSTYGDAGGENPLSLGLLFRPSRCLGVGMTLRNLAEEGPAGEDLMGMGFGIALRDPRGRVTLGLDVETDREGSWWQPAAMLSVEPVAGLELAANGWARDRDGRWDWGAGGMLSVKLGYASVYGGYAQDLDGDREFAAALRVTSSPDRSVVTAGRYVVRYSLPASLSEEKREPVFGPPGGTLLDLRVRLHEIAMDEEVEGVLLAIPAMSCGWAQTQELARSVADLRSHGKKVVAYLVSGGNREYYIAAHADKVVVGPASTIGLTGIASTLYFWTDLMKLLGLEAQFVRIAEYKSAPEPFTLTEPSPAYREAQTAMLDAFFSQLVSGIAAARNVPEETVRKWIDEGPYTASRALSAGLVDAVATEQETETILHTAALDALPVRSRYPFLPYQDPEWGTRPVVAVLTISGALVDGRSSTLPLAGMRLCGSETVLAAIRQIEESPQVDAVLVRIDSPGGSSLASDRINRGLRALAAKVPVVCTMGNTAASGGYYVAVACDRILAEPGTVTGSIGVYLGKLVVTGLLNMLDVHRFSFDRGRNAGLDSMDRRLDDDQLSALLSRIAEVYDLFISRITETRKLTDAEVREIAKGRVWSGDKALELRLVDAHGGTFEALLEAKAAAGLDPERAVDLAFFPVASFTDRIRADLLGTSAPLEPEPTLAEVLDILSGTLTWALDPFAVIL